MIIFASKHWFRCHSIHTFVIHVFVSITKTLVMRVGESLPDDIARSLEASVYTGVSGYIIMSRRDILTIIITIIITIIVMYREYFIDWTCDYELVYYPFDTQVGTPLLP